jgi:hypothetical protein
MMASSIRIWLSISVGCAVVIFPYAIFQFIHLYFLGQGRRTNLRPIFLLCIFVQ